MRACKHQNLRFDSTLWQDGYVPPTPEVIQQALRIDHDAVRSKKHQAPEQNASSAHSNLPADYSFAAHTFPAPLVECEDELYHGVREAPQPVGEWLHAGYRNPVTPKRRTIYVVPAPKIADEVAFMRAWEGCQRPNVPQKRKTAEVAAPALDERLDAPQTEDIAGYLRAFYHGLPVKMLNRSLSFVAWKGVQTAAGRRQATKRVGLATNKETIGIRYRPSPDGIFSGQLNLNDMLDVAATILPTDAYALIMLVHQDLYEDEEDDFCCGRAYGGSRICLVSTARYHPALDATQHIDREHMWPASHCIRSCGNSGERETLHRASKKTVSALFPCSAIAAGVDAFVASPRLETREQLSALWLGRVCKTASHELGHCFCIGHCSYFACIMQSTANIAEDTRQPPYLCPVDLAKVLTATGSDPRERYQALLDFCERRDTDGTFAAFAAWITTRLQQLGSSQ